MLIDPNTLMFGVDPKILQGFAKRVVHYNFFGVDQFIFGLGAPEHEVRPVIKRLLKAGYIVPSPHKKPDQERYQGTDKLNRLALASIGTGFSRTEAKHLLDEVIASAQYINEHQQEFNGYSVHKLYVFGSYLDPKKEILGDLDIAFVQHYDQSLDPTKLVVDYEKKTTNFWESMNAFNKNQTRFLGKLRCHKPKKISLHEFSGVLELKTPYQEIYSAAKASS